MTEPTKASVRCLYVDPSPADVVVERLDEVVDGAVETARGFEGALERLRETDADCVVSRYDLPGGTGIDLVRALREAGDGRPFLLYTERDDGQTAREAVRADVTEYVLDEGTASLDELSTFVDEAITGEVERRRRMWNDQLIERVFDSAPTSMMVIDKEGYIKRANQTATERYDFASDGTQSVFEMVNLYTEDGEPQEDDKRPALNVMETGEPLYDWRGRAVMPDGDELWVRSSVVPIENDQGEIERALVSFEDITDEREQRKRLKTQRDEIESELTDVFARVTDAFFALDDDWNFTLVNEQAEQVLQRDADEILGRNVWEEFPEARGSTFQKQYELAMEKQEAVRFEEYYEPLDTWFEVRAYPSDSGVSVYFRDISDRVERERELNARLQQQGVVADIGQRALELSDITPLLAETAERVREALDVDACEILELRPDGQGFNRQTIATDRNLSVGVDVPALTMDDIDVMEPLGVTQFGPDADRELSVTKATTTLAVTIGANGKPWGIILAHSTEERAFSTATRRFMRSISTILSASIERQNHDAEISRQHERLTALNQLSDVVTDINHVLADQTSREAIEQIIVDRLSESESYSFAWIGSPTEDGQICVREITGGAELSNVTLPVGTDPPGRAFETGEMQFETNSQLTDDAPIRDRLDDLSYQSAASIPLEYEGKMYGVLTLYADRPDAFLGRERHVVGQLGEIAGLALGAIERDEKLRERRRQLEHERERLEYVNRLLRHNLLNGLNVAHARAEILTGSVDPDVERHLETVQTRLDDMIGLVETMRSLMRILVEEENHELQPIALDETLQKEMTKVRTAYDEAQIVLSGPLPPVQVAADELLPEVFENLLVNAIEHNDKDRPEVAIHVDDSDESMVDVHVIDNGPGVPDDIKDHLFEKGKKGSRSKGTGFGLYLVKETLDAYGGEIDVIDRDGGGADFVVSLPRTENLGKAESMSTGNSRAD
ncbi:PAS domain-containing protein [Haloarchaeobius sp. TZWWS8]|uniref:PAS domain-containing protein n=1 Tax=Haloarchaeobius sp. TZWWS8 TaxID=3446121 RepID=UPI003EB83276